MKIEGWRAACLVCFIALAMQLAPVHGHRLSQFGAVPAYSTAYAHTRHLTSDSSNTTSTTTAAAVNKTEYGCPKDSIYDDPWVQQNFAVTYGLKIRDGLGSQTARTLGIYAVAAALGIRYYHSPFECIGHVGGVPHWRNKRCDTLPEPELHKIKRISKHITLPSTTTANVKTWSSKYIFRGDWEKLAKAAVAAKAAQQPMLVRLELADEFISVCPDIFYHVPQWQPKFPLQMNVSTTNTSSSSIAPAQQQQQQQSWLLRRSRSCRIVVHMRRGDLATSASADREMPATYYINLVKNLIKVLDSMNQDYSVEWFTEPSTNAKEHEEILSVRREVPNLTLLFDSDLLWTWHQMWTADIFVMSKSGYSFVPAVVNTQGIVIHAPANGITKCKVACSPSHWFDAQDDAGNITDAIENEVRRRAAVGFAMDR